MDKSQMNENNLQFLKQYLWDLYVLEMEDAYAKKALTTLIKGAEHITTDDIVEKANKHRGTYDRKYGEYPEENPFDYFFDTVGGAFWGIGFIAFILYFFDKLIHSFWMVVIVAAVGSIIVGLIVFKCKFDDLSEAKEERAHLNQELEHRVNQYMADKKDAINSTTDTGNDILAKKNKLYSLDIIYGKYRNLVAIAQFVDYLESGRCTKLTGTDGAYNLFESEVGQNMIITSLEIIDENLGSIMNNQYMLYNALQKNNKILSRIEDSTAIIAYNTGIMNRNVEIYMRY